MMNGEPTRPLTQSQQSREEAAVLDFLTPAKNYAFVSVKIGGIEAGTGQDGAEYVVGSRRGPSSSLALVEAQS